MVSLPLIASDAFRLIIRMRVWLSLYLVAAIAVGSHCQGEGGEAILLKHHVPALAVFLVVIVLVLTPLLGSLLPPVDTAHYVILSAAFLGQSVEGELKYPPVVPFLFLLVRAVSFGVLERMFLATKILGAILLATFGAGAYYLLWKMGRNLAAALAGGVFSAFTIVYLETVTWGGYPQLLGLALFWFAAGTAVEYCRSQRRRYGLATAVLLGLLVGTHTATAFFAFVTVGLLVVVSAMRLHRLGSTLRDALLMAVVVLLVSVASLPSYLATFKDSVAISPLAYHLGELAPVLRDRTVMIWVVIALIQVPILLGLMRFRKNGLDYTAGLTLGATAAGALLTMLLLPSLYPYRSQHFLVIPVIVSVGMCVWYWTRTRGPGWIRPTLILLLLSPYVYYSLGWYQEAVRYYSPASSSDVAAYKFLRSDGPMGGVIVASTMFPNAHAWWIESVAGLPTLIEDDLIWYLLNSERQAITLARTVTHSVTYIDGGSIRVLDSFNFTGFGSPSVFVRTPNHYFDVIGFDDESSYLTALNDTGGDATRTLSTLLQDYDERVIQSNGSVVIFRESKAAFPYLNKTIQVSTGPELKVSYGVKSAQNAGLVIRLYMPTANATSEVANRGGGHTELSLSFRRRAARALFEADFSVGLTVELEGFNFAGHSVLAVGESGLSYLEIQLSSETSWTGDLRTASFGLVVEGFSFVDPTFGSSDSLLCRANVTHVFIAAGFSDRAIIERFERDKSFEKIDIGGTLVFRFTCRQ